MKIFKTTIKRQGTKVILANGSERGDYINMNYVFQQFHRVHDGIQLMKTYYPNDSEWTAKGRISDYTKKVGVNYAWDYEYDDYHPFDVFEEDSTTIKEMKDVISFGSEVHLTLTLDTALTNEELIQIVKEIDKYGTVYLRINHEVNGDWFHYNVFNTEDEVGSFFVRFHKIIKQNSTNIYTVFNVSADCFVSDGIVTDKKLRLDNEHIREALAIADFWAIDKYTSLYFGWPFADEVSNETSFQKSVENWWMLIEETYLKMIWKNNGVAKKLFITEFNADSDVDGYEEQARIIQQIYEKIAREKCDWIEGIVLYQFRDYAGLGLEKGDKKKFVQLPSLHAYNKAIKQYKFDIDTDKEQWNREDYAFYWNGLAGMRGLKVADCNAKSIKNLFHQPIYIVDEKNQEWFHLCKEEVLLLEGKKEFIILIPPVCTEEKVRRQFMIRDIRKRLELCMEN